MQVAVKELLSAGAAHADHALPLECFTFEVSEIISAAELAGMGVSRSLSESHNRSLLLETETEADAAALMPPGKPSWSCAQWREGLRATQAGAVRPRTSGCHVHSHSPRR